VTGWAVRVRLWLAHPRAPLVLLGVVVLASTGARIWRLTDPGNAHSPREGLVFDEKYYVNAARVLLSIPIPCSGSDCDPYSTNTPGTDPNSEHPPLGKLLVAAGMKLYGDNPVGWRFFPVIFGTLALVAVYWLVRVAGGGRWLALGAASLAAVDNLFLLHGRIATLDIFVVVFMLGAVALYLRGHPILAGGVLGIGACVKLVAPFGLAILLLLEVGRVLTRREWQRPGRWRAPARRLVPLLYCSAAGVIVYLGLLDLLDVVYKPFHQPNDPCPGSGNSYGNSLVHTRFMLCYAAKLTSPSGPTGIASYPWQWLLNQENINYYTLSVTTTIGSDSITQPKVAFQGVMNPAIIFLALPALAVSLHTAFRDRDDLSILPVAWFLATFLPFVADSWREQRTTYLYYMVIVLPGIYIAVARLLSNLRPRLGLLSGYVAILGYEFWALYPFRTWGING